MTHALLLHRTAVGAAWMVAWRIVTRCLGLLSTVVLARVLIPEDFGLMAMATVFAAGVEAMSQFGLQDALVRHPDADRLMNAGFTLQLLRGLATGTVLAVGAPIAAWSFAEPRLCAVLLVLAATALAAGAENVGIVAFRRDMRFDRQFALLTAPRLVQVMVTVPLAVLLHNYWALVAGIVLSRLVRTAMTYVVHPFRPRFGLDGWRDLAQFSAWTWIGSLAGLIWDRCDPFVLGPGFGTGGVGLYVQAQDLAALPSTEIVIPVAEALFAGIAVSQRQGDQATGAAPMVAVALVMGILPGVIALSCASGDIVAVLLGPRWAGAEGLIAVLAWQGVFAPFAFVVGVTLMANGMAKRNFVANAAASTVKLSALIVAVALTRRLETVAWVAVGCVAVEAAIFLILLPRSPTSSGGAMGGLVRAILAGGAALLLLRQLGLAWQTGVHEGWSAFADGLVVGAVALAAYTIVLAATWLAAGRPDGPERQLAVLVRGQMQTRLAR